MSARSISYISFCLCSRSWELQLYVISVKQNTLY